MLSAQADNKNSPKREILESGTAFLLLSLMEVYHRLEIHLGHDVLFVYM